MNSRKTKHSKLHDMYHVDATSLKSIPTKSSFWRICGYVIGGIFLTILIIFYLLFSIVRVDGQSMDPTLHSNQFLLLKKHTQPSRFDIAVLTERLESKGPEKQIIKRIIGFGGERVTVLNGRLFINDTEYIEGYLSDELSKHFKEQSFTIVVPDGYVFVMGDNRDISKDSRSVGCFKLEAINGVILR